MPRFNQDYDPETDPHRGPQLPPPSTPPPTTPPTVGDWSFGTPNDFGSFNFSPYGGPSSPDFGDAPAFGFNAPSLQQAMNEPGYQFRLNAGEGALQNAAAAKGLTRTGGSLKDLIQYGQNFGQQEYSNVYNRAYQLAKDAYAPQYASWQSRNQAAMAAFNRAYDAWLAQQQLAAQKEQLGLNAFMWSPPAPPHP